MRIVHFIDHVNFHRGGPARAVFDQVRVMHERGHQVTLATLSAPDVPADWLGGSSSPRCVLISNWRGRLFNRVGLSQLRVLAGGADIFHLHGVWEPTLIQASTVAYRANLPVVISLRGMLDDWCMGQGALKKRLYLALGGRRMLERASVVHCTAQAELDQSRKWFPRGRGMVAPNLMDLSPFLHLPGPDEARSRFGLDVDCSPTILFLSRISYKKGIEHLLDAAALVGRLGTPLRIIIAGSGDEEYERRMRTKAMSMPPSIRVDFVGHVGGSLKLSLLQASDLFVLPTSQENFGFVFFEALAAGLPVLTTDLVDTKDEIFASGAGEIVSQDGAAIADRIVSLLADRVALRERGACARSWTLEHLATDRVAAQFEAIYAVAGH
ncbi:MAG: glycosyltransferase [Planctomycetota bacterium]|nr:glycosyltransferase [Planctomycetota bacterium]